MTGVQTCALPIYYGWVRPPHLMRNKCKALDSVHWGKSKAEKHYAQAPEYFDYGPLDRLGRFQGSHPAVMQEMIARFDWQDKLQYDGKPNPGRELHKHERPGIRLLSLVEKVTGPIGTFKNYQVVKR